MSKRRLFPADEKQKSEMEKQRKKRARDMGLLDVQDDGRL
jgi:hypothetical protein